MLKRLGFGHLDDLIHNNLPSRSYPYNKCFVIEDCKASWVAGIIMKIWDLPWIYKQINRSTLGFMQIRFNAYALVYRSWKLELTPK